MTRRKANENKVIVGNISDVSGEVNIAAGDIYKGFTAEQVSVLLTQITSTFQPKTFDGKCPYKGLDVFEEEDADLFFGRERLVDDLVNRVRESRTVFITGPSGSGKSSLVRAGLIHALKQGAIKDLHSEHWLYETMKPGREPISELTRVTSSLAATLNAGEDIRTKGLNDATVLAQWCEIALKDSREKRVVIFIDQFEEVFTQITREVERLAFLNLLTHAATVENGRVIILFAMRSDFVSNCATYPQLNALLNQQFVQIGAMQPDELVSAIAQPALRVGLRIEPNLIAQIINEMEGEPGALPLMQFALKDLFDAQQAKNGVIALTLNDYLQRGGIHKALERHADDSFAKLDKTEQELARSVFGGLIEIGRGTQDTSRTALFDELIPANRKAEEVKSIIEKLADARLITTDEQAGKDTVTISHEKLIDAWPWLKKLVNENRDVIALQNQIAEDSQEWEAHARDVSYLYVGARLATIREKSKEVVLSEKAQAFVKASIDNQEQNRRRAERTRRWVFTGLSLTALVMAGLALWGNGKAAIAQTNEKIARSRELAALALAKSQNHLDLSLLLSVEAYRTYDNYQTRGAMLDVLRTSPSLLQFFPHRAKSVAFSPDGKYIVSGSCDKVDSTRSVCTQGSIHVWEASTGQEIAHMIYDNAVTSVAFSPDGNYVVWGSGDKTVQVWEVSTGKEVARMTHDGYVYSVAFSPDGKYVVSGSYDQTARVWETATGKEVARMTHDGYVYSVAFSPDGKTVATSVYSRSNGIVILWNVETGQPIGQMSTEQSTQVESVAFSPDGKTLASGGCGSTDYLGNCEGDGIDLWDMVSRKPISHLFTGSGRSAGSVAFSPDGKTLISGGDKVILWGVTSRQPISQLLSGHTSSVKSVAFSPDGKTLASGSLDGTVILWDVANHQPIGQPLSEDMSMVWSLAFSKDGKTIASAGCGSIESNNCQEGEIILWDVISRQPIGRLISAYTSGLNSVAFRPSEEVMAYGAVHIAVISSGVVRRSPISRPLMGGSLGNGLYSVTFSPDGKTLASGDGNGTLILWDVETRRAITQLHADDVAVYSVAFSPDGKTLASGGYVGNIILWDVSSHQPIGRPLNWNTRPVYSLAFSLDGKIIASGSSDNSVILWDVANHQPMGQPFNGHSSSVKSVAFSPDGKTLVSGGNDGTTILWDAASGQPIGQPLSGQTKGVNAVAFSRDGKTLAAGSEDNTIILWNMDPLSWIQRACQRAGRNFSRAEWIQYFPNEVYRTTCPQWPLGPEATPTP